MKPAVTRFLNNYGADVRRINRLVVSSYLRVNEMRADDKSMLLPYIIEEGDEEWSDVICFSDILCSQYSVFDLELLIDFLNKNPNYFGLLDNNFITLDEILYFLRNKPYKSRKELLEWILMYVEMRHGIFERAKRFTATSSNDNK